MTSPILEPAIREKLAKQFYESLQSISAMNESGKDYEETNSVFKDLVGAHLEYLIISYLALHPSLVRMNSERRRIVHVEVGGPGWEPTAQDLQSIVDAFQTADVISRVAEDLQAKGVIASVHMVKARRIEVEGEVEFKLIPYYQMEGQNEEGVFPQEQIEQLAENLFKDVRAYHDVAWTDVSAEDKGKFRAAVSNLLLEYVRLNPDLVRHSTDKTLG